MKQVLLTGLAAALSVTAASNVSPSEANDQVNSNPDESHQRADASGQKVSEPTQVASATKLGERQLDSAVETPKPVIATIRTHAHSSRQATTVYVRNIPIVTFLGAQFNASQSTGVKVASIGSKPGSFAQPDASNVNDPVWRATKIAAKLNQLEEAGLDAKSIKVVWKQKRQSYVIHSNNKHLIEVTSRNTLLPNANKNAGKDALQIANRLRYQLGKAEALKEIEGLPKPKDVQTIAMGPVRFQMQGMASWYGPGFHGNLTANGETYNQYALTAASRTLPFGTRVRVTNLDNGRTVVVRVNDRGPFVGDRILDLSMGAAQILGTVSSGVSSVRLDVLQ